MNTILNWRKGLFERTYEILSNNKLVAKITRKPFTHSAFVQLPTGSYNFKTHGIFKKETAILDMQNKVVGNISFGAWGRSAEMLLFNNRYHWQYRGILNRKWNIISSSGIIANNE